MSSQFRTILALLVSLLLLVACASPTQQATRLHTEGLTAVSQGDYTTALERFSAAVERDPSFAAAYLDRARVQIEQNEFAAALSDLNKLIDELDPNLAEAYYLRGKVAYLTSDLGASVPDLEKALEIDSEMAPAFVILGALLREVQRFDEAQTALNAALALDATLAEAYIERANLSIDQDDAATARTDLEQAFALAPQSALAYAVRGRLGDADYATKCADYEQAISLAPDNPRIAVAYNGRGLVCHRANDRLDLALADYTRALELRPILAVAYFNRGDLYIKLNRYQEAIQDFDVYIALRPQALFAYRTRGFAHEQLGNLQAALHDYVTEVHRSPEDSWTLERLSDMLTSHVLLNRDEMPSGWTIETTSAYEFPDAEAARGGSADSRPYTSGIYLQVCKNWLFNYALSSSTIQTYESPSETEGFQIGISYFANPEDARDFLKSASGLLNEQCVITGNVFTGATVMQQIDLDLPGDASESFSFFTAGLFSGFSGFTLALIQREQVVLAVTYAGSDSLASVARVAYQKLDAWVPRYAEIPR
ncbi:MAG: tetratricopeptide repeat protein [Oscillochloridaceae bacterium umkhey_bin13]